MVDREQDQPTEASDENQAGQAEESGLGQFELKQEVGTIQSGGTVVGLQINKKYIETKTIVSVESLQALEGMEATPGDPPYKGLAYFTEADQEIYFGRETLSDKLAARLRAQRREGHFLALIGASGSGKSSLLRAGIVPRLRKDNWAIAVMKPGADPLTALAAALTPARATAQAIKEMRASLLEDADTLSMAAAKQVSDLGVERLLLAVDQFEELFTQGCDEKERGAFVANLLRAAESGGAATVLVSMRADFYDRVSAFPALTELVSQQQAYVTPLNEAELVEVIAEPALRGEWQFVEGLVEQIVEDVGQEPGRLPLLSHALLETWERRRGTVMTLSGYRDAGGVEGAIAQTAEETLARLREEDPAFEKVTQEIFLDLTELGEGTEDTRRVAGRDDLAAGVAGGARDEVLEALVRARLVTTREDGVEVAHEALIRRWPTLREWLADNRERLRFERQLQRDAQQWDKDGREAGSLYRGAKLAQAQQWASDHPAAVTALVREFLEQSLRDQRRARVRQYAGFGIAALALIALLAIYSIVTAANSAEINAKNKELAAEVTKVFIAEQEAQANEATAQANEALVITRSNDAINARAWAEEHFDRAVAALETAEAERKNAEARAAELATARAQAMDSLDQQAALLESLLQLSLTTTPESAGAALAQEDLARQLVESRATQTAVASYGRDEATRDQPTRETILLGASVQGKPIEAVRFGNGPHKILLVGGIHSGKSPSTTRVAEEIIAYYDENPADIPEHVTLFVVPNLNPDSPDRIGQIEGRLNADGVDLNRNWDCQWMADPPVGGSAVVQGAGGTEPLSEPETRALANLIQQENPDAVVAWYAISLPAEVIPAGCPIAAVSEPLAELFSAGSGYQIGGYDTGVVVAGDFVNWLDSIGIPSIGVIQRSNEDSDFEGNLRGLEEIMAFYAQQ